MKKIRIIIIFLLFSLFYVSPVKSGLLYDAAKYFGKGTYASFYWLGTWPQSLLKSQGGVVFCMLAMYLTQQYLYQNAIIRDDPSGKVVMADWNNTLNWQAWKAIQYSSLPVPIVVGLMLSIDCNEKEKLQKQKDELQPLADKYKTVRDNLH